MATTIARSGDEFYISSIAPIIEVVATYFGLDPHLLYGKVRKGKRVSQARMLAVYFVRERMGLSYPEIGRAFGGKDHTTVMSAHKSVKKHVLGQAVGDQMVRAYEVIKGLLDRRDRVLRDGLCGNEIFILADPGTLARLRWLQTSGMFGDTLSEVAKKVLAQKLFEMDPHFDEGKPRGKQEF